MNAKVEQMARRKITVDNLGDEIGKILEEYAGDVDKNLDEVTKKIGRKGVQALKNDSLSKFPDSKKHKKRYGSTWTSKAEKKRLYTKATIYNSQPGLPHLLEHGHASRNGGRVQGTPHISPVEEKLVREFESEVVSKL